MPALLLVTGEGKGMGCGDVGGGEVGDCHWGGGGLLFFYWFHSLDLYPVLQDLINTIDKTSLDSVDDVFLDHIFVVILSVTVYLNVLQKNQVIKVHSKRNLQYFR